MRYPRTRIKLHDRIYDIIHKLAKAHPVDDESALKDNPGFIADVSTKRIVKMIQLYYRRRQR